MGPFPEHLLLQLVNIWQGRGCLSLQQGGQSSDLVGHCCCPFSWACRQPWEQQEGPDPAQARRSPSNLPEKLSVALQRFFFLFLFLASGMSMG